MSAGPAANMGTKSGGRPGAEQPLCARVEPEERDAALAVLLSGPPGDRATVNQFLTFAENHQLNLQELWVARQGGRIAAAALLVPNPGRTAIFFISPQRKAAGEAVAAQLAQAVCLAQPHARVRIAQAVLDLGQRAEARVLEAAGFSRLAELVYMERAPKVAIQPLRLAGEFQVLPWSEANRPRFAQVIMASYEQTLDCPGLLGLRRIEDVIAGHMAVGSFDPRLWFLVRQADQPAAVMLLSRLPARRSLELVYLGVSPAWRGKGLGRQLVAHALSLAAREAIDSVILAVDQRNLPALRLYRALRFTSTARKLALIRVLGDAP